MPMVGQDQPDSNPFKTGCAFYAPTKDTHLFFIIPLLSGRLSLLFCGPEKGDVNILYLRCPYSRYVVLLGGGGDQLSQRKTG